MPMRVSIVLFSYVFLYFVVYYDCPIVHYCLRKCWAIAYMVKPIGVSTIKNSSVV